MTALALYLKFNLLLALAWLLWRGTKQAARLLKLDISHQRTLRMARGLFLGVLAVPALMLLLSDLLQGLWSTGASPLDAGMLAVTANLDSRLAQPLPVAGMDVATGLWVMLALTGLLGFAAYRLLRHWWALRRLTDRAMVWKSLHGVQILLSEDAEAPFSTRVTGRSLVVMPYSLIDSFDTFRIAVSHELQHLRNGDLNWVLVMEAIRLGCCWNPAAWLWQYEFDTLQEYACDEALLGRRQLQVRQYGNCLLEVAGNLTGRRLVASSNMVPASPFGNGQSRLRQRISLMKKPTQKNDRLRSSAWALVLTMGTAVSSAVLFSGSGIAQDTERREYLPVITVPPQYPTEALQQGLEGYVQAEFTVDREGLVRDARVIDSCASDNREECLLPREDEPNRVDPNPDPRNGGEHNDIFNDSAIDAVEQFRFEPRTENDETVETPGVQYMFTYRLENNDDENE